MRWDKRPLKRALGAELDRAFTVARAIDVPGGHALVRRRPLPLRRVLKKALRAARVPLPPWDRDEFSSKEGYWQEVLPDLEEKLGFVPVVTFIWGSMGPMSSYAQVQLLRVGDDRAYSVLVHDFGGFSEPFVFGAVEPPRLRAGFAKLLEVLLKGNELLSCLPSQTEIAQPYLFLKDALREAFWKWMLWVERREPSQWLSLVEDGGLPTLEVLAVLAAARPDGKATVEDVSRALSTMNEMGARLTREQKRGLFDLYFERTLVVKE